WRGVMEMASKERGFSPPSLRLYETEIANGALFVGSPGTVAAKIATDIGTLALSRFDLKYDIGHLSRDQRAASIELYGREVIPRVRELLAEAPDDGDVTRRVLPGAGALERPAVATRR